MTLLIEKHVRVRDEGFKNFVRSLPCLRCLAPPRSQFAHISKNTDACKGDKASDFHALPLCHSCHTEQHVIGEVSFYGGELGVWKAIDCGIALYKMYLQGFKGHQVTGMFYDWKKRLWHESKD